MATCSKQTVFETQKWTDSMTHMMESISSDTDCLVMVDPLIRKWLCEKSNLMGYDAWGVFNGQFYPK